MIRRIVLENFMAHVRTVIEPAQGLTVLIGPNNWGKSAIIHALEMICYNSEAAHYAIRHGAKKAVVTVETQDEDGIAHTISWWRKEKTAGYIIDGREISGMGKGSIPDDLHHYLRMPMIASASGEKQFQLHFGLQKSPIFLLDDPPSRAAQFFASATDADKLIQMQKAHQTKVTYAKRDKEKLDGEISHLDRQLESLEPLRAMSVRLAGLESEYRKLNELDAAIGLLRKDVEAIELALSHATTNALFIGALASLETPPVLKDTQKLSEWIDATERLLKIADHNHCTKQTLRPLEYPPILPPTDRLRQACHEIDEASRRIAMERARADALQSLAPAPMPQDVPAIKSAIQGIKKLEEQFAKWEKHRAALADLIAPPALVDTLQLNKSLRSLEMSIASVQRHELKREALRRLSSAPTLADAEPLKQQIAGIVQIAQLCERTGKQAATLSRLTSPLEPTDLRPMMDSIDKITKAASAESERQETVRQLNREIEQFQRELEQWVEANPRCSACGQVVSVELITAGEHVHE